MAEGDEHINNYNNLSLQFLLFPYPVSRYFPFFFLR